ncbi:hypothetical protein PG994_002281 [Apiospora phragmitis]|uniref:Uncharacterized protein n=1 Tax=Apiospora phragmitis TaxID=2905665 RepID=A0ABR1WVW8_9PEZI
MGPANCVATALYDPDIRVSAGSRRYLAPRSPPPGPDRVLFQIIGGAPIYLGVITLRGVYPNPTIEQQSHSWGFSPHVKGRADRAGIDTNRYPGLDGKGRTYPSVTAISMFRSNTRSNNGGSALAQSYPSANPGGGGGGADPGTGAGGSSGNLPHIGLGSFGSSDGGIAGGSGAFGDGFIMAPMPGNIFAKSQPAFISAPSHMQL